MKSRQKGRNCGDCQACCVTLGVIELEKPPGIPCQHQCALGCGIYQKRPNTCQIYSCLWLLGCIENEELRPDKCGLIFDAPNNTTIENMIVCREYIAGAADSESGVKLIDAVAQQFPVYVVFLDGRRRIVTIDPAVHAKAEKLIAAANKRA